MKPLRKNNLFPRFLKSVYRRDPLTRFIITVGLVDAVMGGVGGYWSLLGLGGMAIGGAIAWHWLQNPPPIKPQRQSPKGYLPPATPLPRLTKKGRE